ncbi:MAG: N-acetylmuramoyl-L-alanine amidase [Selenomonas ruminantium]|jgi:N-acetylmuramoyl-L-alanine amidase|nr:N-acetylmuramoyl-L-alanine amidase [Selenomonas ruminantium]
MRVFINPGHALGGNPDPGCVNPALHLRECDLTITYGSLCGKYLEAAGCEVRLLQSHNLAGESPGYPCVVEAANAWEADVFVSIHVNAGGGRGVMEHPTFSVLRNTNMPAVLVETGFIDSDDVGVLTLHGDEIARALARGVTDYWKTI